MRNFVINTLGVAAVLLSFAALAVISVKEASKLEETLSLGIQAKEQVVPQTHDLRIPSQNIYNPPNLLYIR